MRIYCFGDSNTYGYDPWRGRYPLQTRWVGRLAQETGWEVINAGMNGRCIPRWPEEFLWIDGKMAEHRPFDCLIVMLGGNDLMQSATAVQAAERMEAFLTSPLFEKEKILLVAPPPVKRGTWVVEERLVAEAAALTEQYRALAQKLGIDFADAGEWGVELTNDGVHFTEAGHLAFAEGLKAHLQSKTE